MAFSRARLLTAQLGSGELTAAMIGIGMNFAGDAAPEANIEDTLFLSSLEGMEAPDLRILAVLVSWFGLHASCVNADRLTRLVLAHDSRRVLAFWSALTYGQARDRRYNRLVRAHSGPPLDLLATGTEFQMRRRGPDPRFEGSALRVPDGVLRHRPADVLTPEELAARHRAYRYRRIIGPTYRADMWAMLEENPELTTATLARRTYGSFATAWHVQRDFRVVHPDAGPGNGGRGKQP